MEIDRSRPSVEADAAVLPDPAYVLHLYVAGTNPRSLTAVDRVSRLCEQHLSGRYSLQVIDIYQHPAMAERGQVVAAPTLVRSLPPPLKRIVGNMADEQRVLVALGAGVGDAF